MKGNILHKVLAVFFSVLFLLAGTGFNLINYCCEDYKKVGIEVVAATSCKSVHKQFCHDEFVTYEHSEEDKSCSCGLGKECDLERIMVDVPSIKVFDYDFLNYKLLTAENDYTFATLFLLADFSPKVDILHPFPDIPIPREGRRILSQISILII